MATIQELLQELEQEAPSTRRVLERIPQDRLDWKPHEKSMSLGQLALHVATLPRAIADVSTRPTFDVRTNVPRPSPASVAEVLSVLEASVQAAKEILGGMDDAALAMPWRMMAGDREVMALTRSGLLRTVLFNHWYHHRGQLTVYLRLLGVPLPAVYGTSADENPIAQPAAR